MPKLDSIKIVYHGTTSNYVESLRSNIKINRGSRFADFGQGFYTTSSYMQALNWARKRRDSYNDYSLEPVEGVVLVYNLDIDRLVKLNGLEFNHASFDWARFIHQNRSKSIKQGHNHDFVYGYVADGNVDELIKELDSGKINMTLFKQRIDSNKFGFNDQLSFHSNEAISCLSKQFRVVKYNDEKAHVSNK